MKQQFSSTDESTPSLKAQGTIPMVEARIDAYLTRTCAPLFHSLPEHEALEQRREMYSHLESLIAAYIELGSSESQAVTEALEQFGKEQSVGQAWQQECDTTNMEAGRGTLWSALRPALGYSAINWILLPMAIEVYAFLMNGYYQTGRAVPGLVTLAAFLVFCGEYALFPGYLGFLAARRTRGKTLAASLVVLPVMQLTCAACTGLVYLKMHAPYITPQNISVLEAGTALTFGLNFLGCSILGAGAARWRRRRALRLAGNR